MLKIRQSYFKYKIDEPDKIESITTQIRAPLYWWVDAHRVSLFDPDDNVTERNPLDIDLTEEFKPSDFSFFNDVGNLDGFGCTLVLLNRLRKEFIDRPNDSTIARQIFAILPISYYQTRTVTIRYDWVLDNWRTTLENLTKYSFHEWSEFQQWFDSKVQLGDYKEGL